MKGGAEVSFEPTAKVAFSSEQSTYPKAYLGVTHSEPPSPNPSFVHSGFLCAEGVLGPEDTVRPSSHLTAPPLPVVGVLKCGNLAPSPRPTSVHPERCSLGPLALAPSM